MNNSDNAYRKMLEDKIKKLQEQISDLEKKNKGLRLTNDFTTEAIERKKLEVEKIQEELKDYTEKTELGAVGETFVEEFDSIVDIDNEKKQAAQAKISELQDLRSKLTTARAQRKIDRKIRRQQKIIEKLPAELSEEEKQELSEIYKKAGHTVLFSSALYEQGIEEIKELLEGKTTTVAGPSGVGKSSVINRLQPDVQMETGEISEKIERGKHTTRHSEIIPVNECTYLVDTPGFSSLLLFDLEKEELAQFYYEFAEYEPECKFIGCSHTHEPVCGVKKALEEGNISQTRYKNYCLLYEELAAKKKY